MINEKYYAPFVQGLREVLGNFQLSNVQVGKITSKPCLSSAEEVNIHVGIIKEIQGSITYSMNYDVAKNIVSLMMGGMEVQNFDEISKSAVCEFANMTSGHCAFQLGRLGKTVDITPPTLIHGKNLYMMLSRVETTEIEVLTSLGKICVNVCMETGI